jgi:exodeoxyribonuclease VII large subunit
MSGIDGEQPADLSTQAWTVGELNTEIQQVLGEAGDRFPTHVVGEVAEVDEYPFGTFFELRDLADEPAISCLAWARNVAEFKHDLSPGTEAVVEATVDFYPDRGDCQLLVSDYWPLGESTRQQELDRLREQLAAEGLFAAADKQSVPAHPSCLGLVTSPAGSAREDVWATVCERSPRTDVRLCGAGVQGEDAVPSLLDALDRLDRDPEVETLILTRGGGSDADLWVFNAEPLVRRVAACSTPVVAAIGHEDDETLVEAAADARAMTPTEAGVVATTPVDELLEEVAVLERRVDHAYRTRVESRLDALDRRIESAHEALGRRLTQREAVRDRTRDLARRIALAYDEVVADRLGTLDRRVDRGYRGLARARLDGIETRLNAAMQDRRLAAESDAATARVTRDRLDDIEARIDGAFRARATRELDDLEQRIDRAHRERVAAARVEASETAARRLRVAVAALGVLLALVLGVLVVLLAT